MISHINQTWDDGKFQAKEAQKHPATTSIKPSFRGIQKAFLEK